MTVEPHVRDVLDRFYTADRLAAACVSVLPTAAPYRIVEPSVGGGAFVRASLSRWPNAEITGVDIDPEAAGRFEVERFLLGDWLTISRSDPPRNVDLVLGNPPYSHAEAHVRASLAVAPCVGMLLRLAFLEGQARAAFWREHPPESVHVLSKRPSFTADGRTDSAAYAFFVWRQGDGVQAPPTLRWLDWSPR